MMTSYHRYSHHARRALTHARILAREHQHPRVDTAHLLVGVLHAQRSIGWRVLHELNLEAGKAIPHLASLTLPQPTSLDDVPNDAALDMALELAADESAWLGHHYIGTAHLLLGMTRTNLGNASDLLRVLRVPPEQVRGRVRRALNEGETEFTIEIVRRNPRYSELCRRVITAAEQNSVAMDHETVGIGHLLMILLNERRGSAAVLLRASGLDPVALDAGVHDQDLVLMHSIEALLDAALEVAEARSSHYIGTEHLLLTLTLDTVGQTAMSAYGVNVLALRSAIETQLANKR